MRNRHKAKVNVTKTKDREGMKRRKAFRKALAKGVAICEVCGKPHAHTIVEGRAVCTSHKGF